MTVSDPPLAAALAGIAAAIPADIAAKLRAANQELAMSGSVPGLEVCEEAPGFELPDQLGRSVSLSGQLDLGPVVLVFYRGDWCPFCNLTLRALQNELDELHALGASLLAVSPQSPDHALSLTEKQELGFPVLSDRDQSTIAAYRLQYLVPSDLQVLYAENFGNDLREQNADGTWRLPVPATFVIDRGGVIRARFVDPDYTKRMEPADVLAAVARLTRQ